MLQGTISAHLILDDGSRLVIHPFDNGDLGLWRYPAEPLAATQLLLRATVSQARTIAWALQAILQSPSDLRTRHEDSIGQPGDLRALVDPFDRTLSPAQRTERERRLEAVPAEPYLNAGKACSRHHYRVVPTGPDTAIEVAQRGHAVALLRHTRTQQPFHPDMLATLSPDHAVALGDLQREAASALHLRSVGRSA